MNKDLPAVWHTPDATCANCRFWVSKDQMIDNYGPSLDKGLCIRANFMHSRMFTPRGLYTHPDFFCADFARKKDKGMQNTTVDDIKIPV